MARAAQLHWHRTESHASPLGFELRAQHRGRTWRMYRLADGQWRVKPTDRPQQERTFRKPEDARKYAAEAAMTNPRRKRNPQEAHMVSKTKNPTKKRKWIRVPSEWLRKGMIVKAPEWVSDFSRADEPKIAWDRWPQYYPTTDWYEPGHAMPDPMPKRLLVKYWGEGTDDPDGESHLVALDDRGRELGWGVDFNTGAYPDTWFVEADSIPDLDDAARAQGQYPPSAENPRDTEVDEHAANELELYIDNDEPLYRQWQAIVKNLWKHKAKGRYDSSRAADGFMHLAEAGAKKYAKEFASPKDWYTIFTVPTRREVAEQYAKSFENSSRDENEYMPASMKHNPAPAPARRRKNPGGRRKNGAGLGALIGSTIGTLAGFGAASIPLAALGSLAGGTIGGYIGAPKDRKKRGAAGGAIGGALLGPVGAGIGGYVGGTKPDKDYGGRRNNPSRKALRESNPTHNPTYRVVSDAVSMKIDAASPDEAAAKFAQSEGMRARSVAELDAEFDDIGEGAWFDIEESGVTIYSTRTYRNNPSTCGCSHRTTSLSRRLSNL